MGDQAPFYLGIGHVSRLSSLVVTLLTSFLAPDLFLVTLLTSGDADDVDQAVIVPDVVLAADGAS